MRFAGPVWFVRRARLPDRGATAGAGGWVPDPCHPRQVKSVVRARSAQPCELETLVSRLLTQISWCTNVSEYLLEGVPPTASQPVRVGARETLGDPQ